MSAQFSPQHLIASKMRTIMSFRHKSRKLSTGFLGDMISSKKTWGKENVAFWLLFLDTSDGKWPNFRITSKPVIFAANKPSSGNVGYFDRQEMSSFHSIPILMAMYSRAKESNFPEFFASYNFAQSTKSTKIKHSQKNNTHLLCWVNSFSCTVLPN